MNHSHLEHLNKCAECGTEQAHSSSDAGNWLRLPSDSRFTKFLCDLCAERGGIRDKWMAKLRIDYAALAVKSLNSEKEVAQALNLAGLRAKPKKDVRRRLRKRRER